MYLKKKKKKKKSDCEYGACVFQDAETGVPEREARLDDAATAVVASVRVRRKLRNPH